MAVEAFKNEILDTTNIPDADHIDFKALDRKFSRQLILEWSLIWLLPTIGWTVLYGLGKIESSVLSGFWPHFLPLLLLAPIFLVAPLHARHCGYAVRDHDIHYKTGVIWRKRIALPFCRVQHVEIERNPFERMLGLATLKCFTAGGGSADMKIPALDMQTANSLKVYILGRAGDNDDRA
ncbi:MAG: PH domain-containing protein [Alphaproteobacteria bacterium]|nr:PH domain-containing protein [Alphaproteobacteria bacterium]